MVVKNEIDKLCCFYVSDFHLEMILLPYINKKMNEKIIIKTDKNLRDTIETLITKMNLSEKNKEKILKLGWNIEENEKIENKSNIIIIGNKKYINDVNVQIKEKDIKDATIIDCYNFEDTKDKIENIMGEYSRSLNTTGAENIKK